MSEKADTNEMLSAIVNALRYLPLAHLYSCQCLTPSGNQMVGVRCTCGLEEAKEELDELATGRRATEKGWQGKPG